ncbi:MAG TPA: neutral/alkaline non-lysosomal ceramidase N-terminal domain-containing protein [Vicinamibacteria bacterium]
MRRREFLTLAAGAAAAARERSWRAGVASVDITPEPGIWMAGFAARTCPSEAVALPLRAKALALEDGRGRRAVLVTVDLLGVTAAMTSHVADALRRSHGLPREALLVNASHTHSGPVTADMLSIAYDLPPGQDARIAAYTAALEAKLAGVAARALAALRPARLSFAEGRATFAANRRVQFTPDGPVDHAVPVLEVAFADGSGATAFGYACHNTTLQAQWCALHGDYAGVAQAALERRRPGTLALFVAGCGGDANPRPRGTLELAEAHGAALAAAVEQALGAPTPVGGTLGLAYGVVELPFAPPPTRAALEARRQDADVYVRRHARLMLDALLRDGRLPTVQPAPVQVWRFGESFTLVAIGGEVVVDYALRLKKDYAGRRLWVAGYSNDVFGYLPSLRVLQEGGYEGGGAMIYYGRPGPFAPPVEELVHAKVRDLMREASP